MARLFFYFSVDYERVLHTAARTIQFVRHFDLFAIALGAMGPVNADIEPNLR